jgi:Na+/proline symporter
VSDIGLHWGPLDILALALIVGFPGIILGAVFGAIVWRRHRVWGALLGAAVGLALWLVGFYFWKMSPWG